METTKKSIFVTQPAMPPLYEFIPYLEKIWENKVLTNCGPFHEQLEAELCKYLGVKYISLFCNATIALLTAFQALRITGEVITTPYSFVATSHSLLWNGLKPVFVDIDPTTLNLDPNKIEAAITPNTTAILPVHCYGNVCDVEAIQNVADKYNLKVIYDAAHAFGVEDENGSILNYGDLSILSFHATKVFNTFEGGAIISHDEKTKKHIDHLKNFGFVDETTVVAAGINGKMSEINAAFGLLQLKKIEENIKSRKRVVNKYIERLSEIEGIRILINTCEIDKSNYSYFPVIVESNYPKTRDELYTSLKKNDIYARRYFYPLISDFNMYKINFDKQNDQLSNAKFFSERVICLPIYPDLSDLEIERVISIIQ